MNQPADKDNDIARLHEVLADSEGLTNAELRSELTNEGVDVEAFLARMKAVAPQQQPSSQRSSIVAGIGDSLKKLADLISGDDALPDPVLARNDPRSEPTNPDSKKPK